MHSSQIFIDYVGPSVDAGLVSHSRWLRYRRPAVLSLGTFLTLPLPPTNPSKLPVLTACVYTCI